MRGVLLEIVLVGLACISLFRPRIGLLGWLWFGLMHPDLFAYIPNAYNASLVLATLTLAGSLRYATGMLIWVLNPVCRWTIFLLLPILLSAICAVRPELSWTPLLDFARMMIIVLLIPLLIRTLEELRTLLMVIALSIGAIGVKFGLWGLVHGGTQYSGGFGSLDNNTLAAGFVAAIPLCWYLLKLYESRLVKLLLLFVFCMLVAAVIMTHSRGASLAVAAEFLLITLRSRRKFALVALLAIATVPAVYMVRDTYLSRMSTIKSPEEERSALARIVSAHAAVRMWGDYPLLGVGFGAANQMRLFRRYVDQEGLTDELVVHNTYLQMLVDSGTFALLVYAALLFGTIFRLGLSARKMRQAESGLEAFPVALQTALVGWAVATVFLSRVQADIPYILLMSAAAWVQLARTGFSQETGDTGDAESDPQPAEPVFAG